MNFCLKIAALLVFVFSFALNSQETGKITGRITDSKTSAGLRAELRLFLSPETFISGTKCDSSGSFSFEKLNSGTYKLEVSLIEYSTLTVDNIKLNYGETLLMDTLKLKKQNISTGEILVEDEKSLVEFSQDKKIFNVDKSMLSKGGTAIDVLKKVPMVDVDVNDNVSLRGSQNVKILIDDKPSRYASLKQIPADAIERVELITNPPAKYEAEGVTGIINIVMKKSEKLGFTGSANLGGNYSQRFSGWGGTDLNFKKNKLTIFSGLYSGTWNNPYKFNSTTEYFSPISSLLMSGSGRSHGNWLWGQGGVEYEFSPGKTIGFEGSIGTGKWFNKDDSRSDNLNSTGGMTSFFTQLNDRNGLWENITGSLYFNNKLNELGEELSGDLTLTRNRNENKFSFIKHDYDSLSVLSNLPLDQRDTTMIKSYNINAQLDYIHPFTKVTKIETGYKGTFRFNDNNFTSDTLDYIINNYVNNQSITNHFKFDEYISAAYAMFSSSFGGFSFKLGLRAEQTNTKGQLLTNSQDFTQNYFDIFPTVNLSQKIGTAHQLQLSYSRRITRPNIWRLNPFVNKRNPRFIFVGNPQLKPEFTDSYELSFMFYSSVISITPIGFFRQNHDVISSYSYLIDSNVSVTTYRNATGSKAYGMDLLLSSRTLSWLNLNATISLYNTKFDSDPLLTDYAQEEGFSWKANIRTTFTLPGLFNIELYYTYTGKKVNAQGFEVPSSNFDMAISKTLLKDKLTLSLRGGDIFKTVQWGQDVSASGYKSSFRNDWSSRNVSISISYRFGNTDEYFQKKKKTKQNTNEGTDQQDSNQGR
ncbi:MAG: TonB-dependent receptor [Chlorobi bacterium]|nr:TonB-dependent receptor [Chlorobiota bacterium]